MAKTLHKAPKSCHVGRAETLERQNDFEIRTMKFKNIRILSMNKCSNSIFFSIEDLKFNISIF